MTLGINTYTQALEMAAAELPMDPDPRAKLGRLLFSEERHEEAVTAFTAADALGDSSVLPELSIAMAVVCQWQNRTVRLQRLRAMADAQEVRLSAHHAVVFELPLYLHLKVMASACLPAHPPWQVLGDAAASAQASSWIGLKKRPHVRGGRFVFTPVERLLRRVGR